MVSWEDLERLWEFNFWDFGSLLPWSVLVSYLRLGPLLTRRTCLQVGSNRIRVGTGSMPQGVTRNVAGFGGSCPSTCEWVP